MDNGAVLEEAQKQKVARKRIAIAAEALSSASDVKIPNIPKTEAVLRVLGASLPFRPSSLQALPPIVCLWQHICPCMSLVLATADEAAMST